MMPSSLKPSRRALAVAAASLFAASNAFAHATTVREPAWGLPHIFAETNLELARENGKEIAKDRVVQMMQLARAGRGTLAQAFGLLDPSFLDSDAETRRTAYTSSELQAMYHALPAAAQTYLMEYC